MCFTRRSLGTLEALFSSSPHCLLVRPSSVHPTSLFSQCVYSCFASIQTTQACPLLVPCQWEEGNTIDSLQSCVILSQRNGDALPDSPAKLRHSFPKAAVFVIIPVIYGAAKFRWEFALGPDGGLKGVSSKGLSPDARETL